MTRIIVKAMPSRAKEIAYLRLRLPHAEWCFDRGLGAKDTFLRGLEMAGADASVHMEEDIVLTKDFLAKLEAAIAQRPAVMIQFFSMRQADLTVGSRFDSEFMMNQCHYFPATYCAALRRFADTWSGWLKDPTGYDLLMRAWMRSRHERYWIHVPSLVDHRIGPSLISRRRSSRRQSLTFREADV